MQQVCQCACLLAGQDASKPAQPSSSLPSRTADDPHASEHKLGTHQALQQQQQQQLNAGSEAEASSTMTDQQDAAAAASTEMLLSSYSPQKPAQPTDKAGAEAADLPARGVLQQGAKGKPEHAAFRAIAGDMPVRRCTEQQQH